MLVGSKNSLGPMEFDRLFFLYVVVAQDVDFAIGRYEIASLDTYLSTYHEQRYIKRVLFTLLAFCT